jgi:hypothetical protein
MDAIQMVDLKKQYNKIKTEVDKAVLDVLESTCFYQWEASPGICGQPWKIPWCKACDTMR